MRLASTGRWLLALLLAFTAMSLASCESNEPKLPPVRSKTPLSDATMLCTSDDGKALYGLDTTTQASTLIAIKGTSRIELPAISPDRRTIAYVGGQPKKKVGDQWGSSICLMSADGKQKTVLFKPRQDYRGVGNPLFLSIDWAPDGRKLYICETSEGIYSLDMTGHQKTILRADPDNSYDRASASPGGTLLAFLEGPSVFTYDSTNQVQSGPLYVFNLTPGARQTILTWLDDQHILISLLEIQEIEMRRLPYRTSVLSLNLSTGSTQVLFTSRPWQILTNLTLSPAKDKIALMEFQQAHDPALDDFGYMNGIKPQPAVLDLQTRTITPLVKPAELAKGDLDELEWASPGQWYRFDTLFDYLYGKEK